LEHLSNAYKNGFNKKKILSYVQEINSIGQTEGDNYKSFSESDLHKISTSYQEKTLHKIDSLQAVIEKNKKKPDKNLLLDNYTELLNIQEYHFERGKFQGYDYKKTKINKAKLEIEVGELNKGCAELYEADMLYFYNKGYAKNACKSWNDKRSAVAKENYKKAEKRKAKKWYSNHPNLIKFRSLLGEGFTTIEAYLGAPIDRNYKIDVGVGIDGQQYIGNKYKNEDGVYEVGFRNGNAIFIQFYPSSYIKYSPEVLDGKNTIFDMDGGMSGVCSGEVNNGHIGKIQMYSIDYDCSDSGLSSTVFYGLDGKLLSVIAY
jgi:hypothetical protein